MVASACEPVEHGEQDAEDDSGGGPAL